MTGNWGKFGTGIRSWTAGAMDGMGLAMMKGRPGMEATDAIIGMRDAAIEMVRQNDPSVTSEELAARELAWLSRAEGGGPMGGGGRGRGGVEAFWWYWHVGYAERWQKTQWGDDTLPRRFDEYFDEALESGWWEGVAAPGPEHPPKMLIECGGNMLRRTRGGKTALLEHLWPKLQMIVSIDFRINSTGLMSDILLPAAQHYEKLGFHIPTPHQMMMTFSDRAAEPAGEAKPEWEIFRLLLAKLAERADARGIERYESRTGVEYEPAKFVDRYTMKGYFESEEVVADEQVRDAALVGVLPEGTTLDTMREEGHVRLTGWGMSLMSLSQASPLEHDRTHTPFRNHVELGDPFPTYARRAQFYIEHPWWLEAGEELPVHKPNPPSGGNQPLRMTSGHNRWSIHSMNHANPVILQTHRGEPVVEVSAEDAGAGGGGRRRGARVERHRVVQVPGEGEPGRDAGTGDLLQRLGPSPVRGVDGRQRARGRDGEVDRLRRGVRAHRLHAGGMAAHPHRSRRPLRLREGGLGRRSLGRPTVRARDCSH